MKIENKGKPIYDFAAPVVKGYLEQIEQKTKVTLKGIPENERKLITRKDFEDCVLLLKKGPRASFQSFRIPEEHGVLTILTTKYTFEIFQPKFLYSIQKKDTMERIIGALLLEIQIFLKEQ